VSDLHNYLTTAVYTGQVGTGRETLDLVVLAAIGTSGTLLYGQ